MMDVNLTPIGTPRAPHWDWQYRQLAEVDYVLAGLVDSCGMPDPFAWNDAAGPSRQKFSYLFDLALRQNRGSINVQGLGDLDDDEVVSQLSSLQGVGRWTAEMFLIHQLHRHDVLPSSDIGIRRGIERTYRLSALPSAADVRSRGELWAPYRTFASELLWHSTIFPR
jgi:3-methyladenine DNA glycosylase/8-oxoguanine DNA glycosylase